jgi:hypothetical protein
MAGTVPTRANAVAVAKGAKSFKCVFIDKSPQIMDFVTVEAIGSTAEPRSGVSQLPV